MGNVSTSKNRNGDGRKEGGMQVRYLEFHFSL